MTTTSVRTGSFRLLAALMLGLMAAALGIASSGQAHEPDPPASDRPSNAITGCPSGAVCIYPDDSWNGGEPSYVFWSYGAHRFYDQYGDHRVYNNQWGGATAMLCYDSYGHDCAGALWPGDYDAFNLTPRNSIRLDA